MHVLQQLACACRPVNTWRRSDIAKLAHHKSSCGASACACVLLQILHGCPWVLPRPVFVLACKGPGASADDDIRNTYTLRTKVKQEGAADALAKVSADKDSRCCSLPVICGVLLLGSGCLSSCCCSRQCCTLLHACCLLSRGLSQDARQGSCVCIQHSGALFAAATLVARVALQAWPYFLCFYVTAAAAGLSCAAAEEAAPV
jgi:hypothetical protein